VIRKTESASPGVLTELIAVRGSIWSRVFMVGLGAAGGFRGPASVRLVIKAPAAKPPIPASRARRSFNPCEPFITMQLLRLVDVRAKKPPGENRTYRRAEGNECCMVDDWFIPRSAPRRLRSW